MSFSFSFAGKREDVLAAIDKSIEAQRKYSQDSSQADRAREVIAGELERYPVGKVVYVSATGHHSISHTRWNAETNQQEPAEPPVYSGNLKIEIAEGGQHIVV